MELRHLRRARNLTPDCETEFGAWTDDEIARAIRGGIAKGGRGVLPPVRRAIPATRPPASDDCEALAA